MTLNIYQIDYDVWTTTSITNQMAHWSKDITRELTNLFNRMEAMEKELKETKDKLLNQKLTTIENKLDQLLTKN